MLFISMKTKMTLAVFLLVGFLMSVTAITSMLYFEKKFKQNISLQQSALLDSLAIQIDDRILDFMVELDSLADTITPTTVADPDRAQRLLDAQQRQRIFFDNSLFLFSASGRLLAASPRELNFIGKDFSFRNYFQETIKTGKMSVSAPFASIQKESRPIIMFSTPVYDSRKRIIGVLGGSVDLHQQHYLRSLAALKLGQKGFLSLYAKGGIVLMHPDKKRLLRQAPAGTDKMVAQALAGVDGTGETVTRAGEPILRSVKRLKSSSWVLAVSYPLADAYAPLRTARKYFLAGSLAAAFLSLFIVWPMMRYLTRPLLSFTRHLEQLPDMEEGAARLAPVDSNDEIGQMAKTFNAMLLELGRSRDFYLTLFENFPALIWRSGTDAKCNYVNQTWLDFTGRELEQELGDGWAAGVHPEDHDLCIATYTGAFEARTLFQMEYRLRHQDGEYRWIVDMGRPFYGLDGNFAGYIGACFDVTQRRDFELSLMKSEERYRQLFEDNPHPMWAYDLKTLAFLAVNHAAVRHYGYTAEDFLTMTINDLAPRDEGGTPVAGGTGNATSEAARPRRHLKKDGSGILVEISSQVMNFAGVDAGIVLVHDVTEKVLAEEEKLALEHQLTQSQKMEAIGTLTGGIAHDFNNILTAIIGYSTMMQLELQDGHPLQRKVREILRASERASNLTRSLLAYSRKQVGNPAPVNLNSIIGDVDILLRRLIPENIELKSRLGGDQLCIMADSGQIEQVVMNLVVNARDAMCDGGRLCIVTEPMALDQEFIAVHGYGRPGSYALMTVTDSGLGMDEKTRDRIFEPFFTTKEQGKGTGLGLAMVYSIVKQHGGFINCYSELGHGTVFRIYLPLIDAPARDESAPADQVVRGGEESILLVEDDVVIREMIAELLKSFGYSVIKAVDGEDAVRKFKEAAGSVQLVILDVIMPRMNGREAYNAISELGSGVKVLFMSGYTADIITDSLIKGDPRHFVSKPIKINELLGKVRDLLDET